MGNVVVLADEARARNEESSQKYHPDRNGAPFTPCYPARIGLLSLLAIRFVLLNCRHFR